MISLRKPEKVAITLAISHMPVAESDKLTFDPNRPAKIANRPPNDVV